MELRLPAALVHQVPVLDSPARYKVARCGRRWGKSRAALIASLLGHGPARFRRGVLSGGDVVWLSPDYPQSRAIWREEIKPRFAGLPGVVLNESERRLEVGSGSLELRSAEVVDSIRGRKLDGVVVDEAAHLDLDYAWSAVLLPALVDKAGWAILVSTPNAGQDGNAEHRIPSFFNLLSERVERGDLGSDWEAFSGRTEQNSRLKPEDISSIRAEYPPGSPMAQQELDAKLLSGPQGLVFSEWADEVHVIQEEGFRPPANWRWYGGLDFGFRAPGCFLLSAVDADGGVVVWDELYYRELHAYEVGQRIARLIAQYPVEYIAIDSAMRQSVGLGPTVAEQCEKGLLEVLGDAAPRLLDATKGKGSRAARVDLMHRYLAWKRASDGSVPPWFSPKLRFHKRAANAIRTIPKLPYDPKKIDDVDTRAEDHAFDALGYFLSSRPTPAFEFVTSGADQQNTHPGYDFAHHRLRKRRYELSLTAQAPKPTFFNLNPQKLEPL